MTAQTTLVGIVGYTPVLECFPLGPRLMTALRTRLAGVAGASVDNMSWGPIHIVQQFQDAQRERPDRLILIGGSATSSQPGRVSGYRWRGGNLPPDVVQERIYEAVTGIVDIENTLMIGEHFGVWPDECFTVEADIPANAFGRMVIADNEGWADDRSLTDHLGFSPAGMIQAIADLAVTLAEQGDRAAIRLQNKTAAGLAPVSPFIRNFTTLHREDDRVTGGRAS